MDAGSPISPRDRRWDGMRGGGRVRRRREGGGMICPPTSLRYPANFPAFLGAEATHSCFYSERLFFLAAAEIKSQSESQHVHKRLSSLPHVFFYHMRIERKRTRRNMLHPGCCFVPGRYFVDFGLLFFCFMHIKCNI